MKNVFSLGLLSLVVLSSCKFEDPIQSNELLDYQNTYGSQIKHEGQVRFTLDSFGALSLDGFNTSVSPWKLFATALLNHEHHGVLPDDIAQTRQQELNQIYQRYGFFVPKKIANWKSDWAPEPKLTQPIGILHADAELVEAGFKVKVEISNNNCSMCHTGTTYDAQGKPTLDAWLGMPNTSLNTNDYISMIYTSITELFELNDQKVLAQIEKVFPDWDAKEKRTYKDFILLLARNKFNKAKPMGTLYPVPLGGPGLMNGLGIFQVYAGLVDLKHFDENQAGYVSIPDISNRGFRSSLTADGVYGPVGDGGRPLTSEERFNEMDERQANDPEHLQSLADVADLFSFSAMGNTTKTLEKGIPSARIAFEFLSETKSQTFPGTIDQDRALAGSKIFSESCAKCHGQYSENLKDLHLVSFPNKQIPQENMGTDPLRWSLVTQKIIDFTNGEAGKKGGKIFSKYASISKGDGYVAPLLSGLWATAPYLHNGSVPTIWDLLHPSSRPKKFLVGGHSLDFQKLGIAYSKDSYENYPEDYIPWSTPKIYDTSTIGRSNVGHEKQFEKLSEADKINLIEFLKLL